MSVANARNQMNWLRGPLQALSAVDIISRDQDVHRLETDEDLNPDGVLAGCGAVAA